MATSAPDSNAGSVGVAVRLLRAHLAGEYLTVAAGVAALLFAAGLALLEPWPLKLVVDSVLGPEPLPAVLARVVDRVGSLAGTTATPVVTLTLLCLGAVLLRLLLGLVRLAADYLLIGAGVRMVFRLRCAVFDHVQRLSLVFHDNTTVGDSLYRVAWDTYSIQTVFNNGFVQLLTAIATVGGIALIMFNRDGVLSAVALAFAVPMILVLRRIDGPIQRRSTTVNELESAVTSRVQETLTGIRVVQAFAGEERESGGFRTRAEGSARATLQLYMMQSASGLFIGLVLALGTAAVIWVAGYRVLTGSLTPGDVVLIAAYVAMLYRPLESFAYTTTTIQRAAGGAKRVFDLLDTEPDVADAPGALALAGPMSGRVEFDRVTFAYTASQPVLDDVSFVVERGARVAIVGASGVGKTTIASLLVRFYDPSAGRILIDGTDIKAIKLRDLRSQIAVVLQEPVLFGSTIRENIAYGRPEATDDEIVRAAQAASAHAFIDALPGKYSHRVGERGVNLSGGQRQRLAIARAFLKDAPILLMDEPTSALDTETEAGFLTALRALMRGRTSIVIAHRLSTIRDADVILVLRNGGVAEMGSHDALLRRGGQYADLYQTQFGPAAVKAPA